MDRDRLESMLWTPTLAAGLVQWAWMVLLAAEGLANDETAERLGVSRPTVNLCGTSDRRRERLGLGMGADASLR